MVSTYEYLTLANLETFTGIDYSTVDSTRLADANVEMNITTAEEIINGLLGVSAAQTVTNAITFSTKILAGWLLNNLMNNLGYTSKNTNAIFEFTWDQVIKLVEKLLANNDNIGVDTIPHSGASRYYSQTYRGYYH